MSRRPIIGIPANSLRWIDGLPGTDQPVEIVKQFVNDAYIECVERAGGIAMILPKPRAFAAVEMNEYVYEMVSQCKGLLFAGGDDIHPRFYRESPHPLLGDCDMSHDAFLLSCANAAKQFAKPVLGICNGLQLLNVADGGSLWQDLSLYNINVDSVSPSPLTQIQHKQNGSRYQMHHVVGLMKGSTISRLFGGTDYIFTNSMHHQAIKQIGSGLVVSGYAEDGIPEAIESIDGRVVGVQWHPEEMVVHNSQPNMMGLFLDLIRRASLVPD